MAEEALRILTCEMIAEKIFNCESCDELLIPPIRTVEGIGNVCSDCQAEHEWINAIPNAKLEAIFNKFKLPCKFQSSGCKVECLYANLSSHQHNCEYSTSECLMNSSTYSLGCKWKGSQIDYLQHFMDNHSDHVIHSTSKIFSIRLEFDILNESTVIKLLLGRGDSLILTIGKSVDGTNLLYNFFDPKDRHRPIHNCMIKHSGTNSNCVETTCRDILGASIAIEALKLMTGAEESIDLEVNITNPEDPSSSSLHTQPQFDEKLLQHFECPVCKNLMKPPIFQCKLGHDICSQCKVRVDKCPKCRGTFGGARNYTLEELTAGIQYNCMYSNLGCEVILKSIDSNNHEANCTYKPCYCLFPNCTYVGSNSTIIQHLKCCHAGQVIQGNCFRNESNLDDFRTEPFMVGFNDNSPCQKTYLIWDENAFRLSFKRNSDYSFWAVEMLLRTMDENVKYVYEIGIADMRKSERKLIRTDLCFNEISDDEMFKKCILFPNNILASYASNGRFSYYCEIHKA